MDRMIKDLYYKINTNIEGFDVKIINLWSDKEKRNRIVARLVKNDKVKLIENDETYVKVKTKNGVEGWCMKGFVKLTFASMIINFIKRALSKLK